MTNPAKSASCTGASAAVSDQSGGDSKGISKNCLYPLDPSHLDWSSKQSRILTADGLAARFYCADRGFPFGEEELPHHHLRRGTSHATFHRWSAESSSLRRREGKHRDDTDGDDSALVGAWTRPLFAGAWEHSTSTDEWVSNLQTSTLFVDVRIPRSRPSDRFRRVGSVAALTEGELRSYARQHAFGGYAAVGREQRTRLGLAATGEGGNGGGKPSVCRSDAEASSRGEVVCTRHHVIDWNYLPTHPRNRPNKWWAEFAPAPNGSKKVWKEYSYATDDFGQHYYFERWERLEGDGREGYGPVVAMRKCKEDGMRKEGRDGIIVVIGDHFNYLFARPNNPYAFESRYPAAKAVVDLVDLALEEGDRPAAEHYLSIDAGHGTVSSGWVIDKSVQPWREGTALFGDVAPTVEEDETGGGITSLASSCRVLWDGETWDLLECSGIEDATGLQALFGGAGSSGGAAPGQNCRL